MGSVKVGTLVCAAMAALGSVETLTKPGPHPDIPLVVHALLAGGTSWLAAAGLGLLAVLR